MRNLAVLLTALVLLLGVLAFFLPYLLKRYIETHSVEWINRRITIDAITLNPFTFTYAIDGVTCFEPNSDEVFVSWKSISVNSNLWAGFRSSHWRFRHLRIREPYIHLVQHGERFNFSDLLELGGGEPANAASDTTPTVFSMEGIQLEGGSVRYASDLLKAPIAISGLYANCTRITSESARMDFDLHFNVEGGGEAGGSFKIDTDKSLYAINVDVNGLNLAPLLPYLQDFMHTTALRGSLDLGLNLEDSWADTAALAASGRLALNALDMTEGTGADLIGLRKGLVVLDTLNARGQTFKISQVRVDGLHTRFLQWADGSNTWTKALKLDSTATADSSGAVLAASPANIFVMLADYIRMLGQEFVANQYTADSLSVVNGAVEFEDFTPEKPFRYTLDLITVHSSRITTAGGTADFTAAARLNGRGQLNSTFKFDPKNFRNVQADLTVTDLSLPDLDAYSRWYAAHPISSGTLSYSGTTQIKDGRIDSKNHLQADNLRFGKKVAVHDTGIYILPFRLGAALLKDVHGKIDLDIPVEGDLNDPTFKPWPIVWKVLKNLVVKAAAAPVKLVGSMLGNKDEADVEEVRFPSLGTALGKDQRRSLDALAALLKEKPELRSALVPVTDMQQESEAWAAKQMKMQFLGLRAPMAQADSLRMEGLSLRDSSFTAFLKSKSPGPDGSSEIQRCLLAVGAEAVQQAVSAMEGKRQQAVQTYLEQAGIIPGRITFRPGAADEKTGHVGAPGYRFIVEVQEEPQPSAAPIMQKAPAIR